MPADSLPQKLRPRENLQNVLSLRPLRPPLRNANVSLSYSPDGSTLLVQNPSGLYLVSRDPFRLATYISAEEVYPARFSFDSQTIAVIGHGLKLDRETVPNGPRLEERVLPFQEPCLDENFSPGAEYFACLLPDFKLVVYQLSANEMIFSVPMDESSYPSSFSIVPLHIDHTFPGPFGFVMAKDLASMAGKGLKFLSLSFSPDAKTLLVQNGKLAYSIDLASRQKASLPGELHKRLHGSFCLQTDDRVLIASDDKDSESVIMSLKNGEVLARLALKPGNVHLASDSHYAILTDPGVIGDRVFDLRQNRELTVPDNLALDIFGNEMAVLNDRGTLFLYHLGDVLPFLSLDLPLDRLPVLSAAAVSPSLDYFAFAVDGNGAIFQPSSGERIYSGTRFSAASFPDPSSAFLLLAPERGNTFRSLKIQLASGKSSEAWAGGKDLLLSGGTAIFEYIMERPFGLESSFARPFMLDQGSTLPFQLRALDPASGAELWKRDFRGGSPLPFADPQGDRLVLVWHGDSHGAEEAARHIPSVWHAFKKSKRMHLDTYFEIVDVRSGKSFAGVLFQRGGGPQSVDAAFSVGDVLFVVKDGRRISVLSLQDGTPRAQLIGNVPVANAKSKLFAVEESPGRLCFYDLSTAAKLGEHIFPSPISYMHFSANGDRLFVLTAYQVAYVLDVSSLRRVPAPAATHSDF